MPTRIKSEVIYLRHEFTDNEKMLMGIELAETHNTLQAIDDEEAVVKAQFKERRAGQEQRRGTLSRNLTNSFEMRNIDCALVYDFPNVGEVTYRRKDNEQDVKTRPMTETERQMDLPLSEENPVVAIPPEQSAANVKEFFGEKASDESAAAVAEPEPGPEDAAVDPNDVYPPLPDEDDPDGPETQPSKGVVEMPSPGHKNGPKDLAEFHTGATGNDGKKTGAKKKK